MDVPVIVRLYLDETYLTTSFADYALPAQIRKDRWGRDESGRFLTASLAEVRAYPFVHDLPVVRVVIEAAGETITAASWHRALWAYSDYLRTRALPPSQPTPPVVQPTLDTPS